MATTDAVHIQTQIEDGAVQIAQKVGPYCPFMFIHFVSLGLNTRYTTIRLVR